MSNFRADLCFGNKYENLFCDYLQLKTPNAIIEISSGKFKPYDIKMIVDDKIIMYEIKSDRLAYKTNNICIEYECNSKASGITTSESNFYAYYIVQPDTIYDLYVIPSDVIKECINNKEYHRIMKGGDGYKSSFYLFNKEIFDKYKI